MQDWHFPRPELADSYLELLELGISSSLALIAPRRKGKTLFLLQDFAPRAQKKQYIPVYASLWQNINAPHEGLISALEEAIAALEKRAALTKLFKARIKKTSISNELLGKMEIEFADSPQKPGNNELVYLDKLLAELEDKAGKKRLLLMIDEVQHLSTSRSFDPLTHALRTMLDKRQGRVKSIFTGSSRHYMNLLLNESQSPFYHFVDSMPFPDLGEPFIDFIREKLADDHRMVVPVKPLVKAFSALESSPYWMMKLIGFMITSRASIDEAMDHVVRLLDAAEGLESIAQKMRPIDRIVFLALAEGKNPFSRELLAKVAMESNVKGVPSNIQRAIARLSEDNLVSQIHKGEYYIEKPGLRRYLEAT